MCTRPWILEPGYWAQSGYWNLNSVFCVSDCRTSLWSLKSGICTGVQGPPEIALGIWKLESVLVRSGNWDSGNWNLESVPGATNPCTGLLETGICTGMWGPHWAGLTKKM